MSTLPYNRSERVGLRDIIQGLGHGLDTSTAMSFFGNLMGNYGSRVSAQQQRQQAMTSQLQQLVLQQAGQAGALQDPAALSGVVGSMGQGAGLGQNQLGGLQDLVANAFAGQQQPGQGQAFIKADGQDLSTAAQYMATPGAQASPSKALANLNQQWQLLGYPQSDIDKLNQYLVSSVVPPGSAITGLPGSSTDYYNPGAPTGAATPAWSPPPSLVAARGVPAYRP